MKKLNKKTAIGILIAILFVTFISVVVIASSSSFSVPYTFTSGTTISASEMNANFQAIGGNLPASKSISFGTTTITSTTQNFTGILTVTPPANGYLILYARDTYTAQDSSISDVCIYSTDSSGSTVIDKYCHALSGSETNHNYSYTQGLVTAGTPLYFYMGTDMGITGTTFSGSLSALFIPAPNTLP